MILEASLPPYLQGFASMDHRYLVALLATLSAQIPVLLAQPPPPSSHITIQGSVFCDVCYANTFSRHSYFLSGVDIHIQCKIKANSPGTTEQIAFSVNRTTNRHGVYKLDIPSVEGVDCVEDPAIQSFCQASLIGSSASACNFPGLKSTSDEITVKSKQHNLCIYSLSALSYRPPKRNATLCGNKKMELPYSLNSSKFFLPYFPPYGIPWPQFPPLPQLPPLPSLPFPPLPHFPSLPPLPKLPLPPMPFPQPPSLPFPFPPIRPFFPAPSLDSPPPPPAFNPGDPRTWIPNNPVISQTPPPPPPIFNLGDPRTWIPNNPLISSPPPPVFNLEDPRTWMPYNPPSPPAKPEYQHP